MINLKRLLATIAAMVCSAAAMAAPATLIYINNGAGDIFSYDTSNAYAQSTVAIGTGTFSMSSGPAGNTLYLQVGGGALHTLDLLTPTISTVGGAVPGNALGEGRDGSLYAGAGTELYRVDPLNGLSTLVGSGVFGYAGDIAVDPTDVSRMFGAVTTGTGAQLALIDKLTGGQTLVGAFGIAGDIWGLGFALDGTLYAAGPTGVGTGAIFTVNKTTGTATLAHALTYEPYDMATQPFERQENRIPEPGSLALFVGALSAMVALRRRQR